MRVRPAPLLRRVLRHAGPVRAVQACVTRLRHQVLVRAAITVFSRCGRDDVGAYAGAVTFSVLLSLMPLVLFVSTLLGELHLPSVLRALEGPLRPVIPKVARTTLLSVLRSVVGHRSRTLLSFSLLGYLYGMSGAFRQVTDAFNHVEGYARHLRRPLWKTYAVSVVLSVTVGMALVVATVLLVPATDWLQRLVAAVTGRSLALRVVELARWSVALSFIYASVVVVYAVTPDRPHRLRWLTPGTVVATLGFVLLTLGMSVYSAHYGAMNRIYGALAGLVFVLLYINFAALLLLVGAEVDRVFARRHARGPTRAASRRAG